MARLQQEIKQRADRIEELSESTKIDLSAMELEDPPEFPQANLDWDNLPEPVVDSEWDFVKQVLILKEAKHFRR